MENQIKAIRTTLRGHTQYRLCDHIIKISFAIDKEGTPGYLVARLMRDGEIKLIKIRAEYVTGVIYTDGSQVNKFC